MTKENFKWDDIIHFQTKSFDTKGIKELEDWTIEIEWYASTKNIDSYYDIVEPEAFLDQERYDLNPMILLQHDSNKWVWTCTKRTITKLGLKIKAHIKHNTEWVIDKIKSNTVRWFSIWFRPTEIEYIEKTVNNQVVIVRVIKKLELIEISIVEIPANPFTLFQSVEKYFKNLTQKNMENMEKKDGSVNKTSETFTQAEMKAAVDFLRDQKSIEAKEDEVKEETNEEVVDVAEEVVAEEVVAETEEKEVETTETEETKSEDEEKSVEEDKTKTLDGVEKSDEISDEDKQTEEVATSVENSDEAKSVSISEESLKLLLDTIDSYKSNMQDIDAKINKIGVSKWLMFNWNSDNEVKSTNLDFINATSIK